MNFNTETESLPYRLKSANSLAVFGADMLVANKSVAPTSIIMLNGGRHGLGPSDARLYPILSFVRS